MREGDTPIYIREGQRERESVTERGDRKKDQAKLRHRDTTDTQTEILTERDRREREKH